ncbi:DUF1524 domain-containing protein [Streptomyces sp. NEAU-L66]|uniref:GmrSD restriction endonuclease domain-containing protein n=1 Tax=Streptomyces sp. NEAU-L66 TaxID=3390812 RepID=UPI0039C72967
MVRRLLAGLSTTGNNRVFMEFPKELDKDGSPAEAVRRFLSRPKTGARVWPGNDAIREAIRTRPFYKAGRVNQRFQVLRRLEESYSASEPVDYAKARLTVEHVLPQSPAQQWLDLLAEEAEDGESPEELHALLVHTLGNLTLSGDNARLSNHPFRRKQEILDSSALRMNQRIAAQERWGREQILARAAELADRAVQLWPGPIDGTRQADDEWAGWKELREALLAMPSGTRTTYGDIAALIGTHTISVGRHVGTTPGLHGAYRVHRRRPYRGGIPMDRRSAFRRSEGSPGSRRRSFRRDGPSPPFPSADHRGLGDSPGPERLGRMGAGTGSGRRTADGRRPLQDATT